MNKQQLRKYSRRMMRKPVFWSFLMHFIIAVSFSINLSFFRTKNRNPFDNPPVFIDLSKVEIGEITNLPSLQKKDSPKPNEMAKPKPAYTPPKKDSKPDTPKLEDVKEDKGKEEAEVKKSDGARLETAKPKKEDKGKEKKDKKPKKAEEKKAKKSTKSDDLSSLLSSIEETEEDFQPVNEQSSEQKLSDGIKGGNGGDLSMKITITEKDALISRIRACWNVEAGVKGADKMIVEIHAEINQDGSVNDVEILDSSRYNSDPAFRTIAESARRAIYICEKKGEQSPFLILASKYKNEFSSWKDLYLRFSPLEGVGF